MAKKIVFNKYWRKIDAKISWGRYLSGFPGFSRYADGYVVNININRLHRIYIFNLNVTNQSDLTMYKWKEQQDTLDEDLYQIGA